MRMIVSEKEWRAFLSVYINKSLEAHCYWEKYFDVLPLEMVVKQYDKINDISLKYEKLFHHSMYIDENCEGVFL